jgi:RNA polymerase sigma factor (sigma-70 family)
MPPQLSSHKATAAEIRRLRVPGGRYDLRMRVMRTSIARAGVGTCAADEVVAAYDAWATGLYRYIRALTGDRVLAEDLLHEAFLRLHATLLSGKTIEYPRAWLHKVCRRLVIDAQQSYAARHLTSLVDELRPLAVVPMTFVDEPANQWREIWRVGATALSPRERECLQLRVEGFTHREIADILCVRTGTVCTLVARAIQKVQRRLARRHAGRGERYGPADTAPARYP